MKRQLLIALCCLTAAAVSAQTFGTVSNLVIKEKKEKKKRTPLKLEVYGKLGLNITNAEWCRPFSEGPSSSAVGFDLNIGLLSHFRPTNPSDFYWGAELSLTQVGGKYDQYSFAEEGYYHSSYYDWPADKHTPLAAVLSPSIGWEKEIASSVKLDIHFNPGFLLCLSTPECAYTVRSISEYNDYTNNIDEKAFNQANISIKGGIGVWYKSVNFDISYRYVSNAEFSDYYNNNSNIIFSIGYRL